MSTLNFPDTRPNGDPLQPGDTYLADNGVTYTYDGVKYKDQRGLLDSIMKAMDLATTYDNETQVKGILYLVEIDDVNAPVTLSDLAFRGIE